jgi:SAM-dependent methyltransferase
VGEQFALSLGYPGEILDTIPRTASEGFAGVSNVAVFAILPVGGTVVDLGCGSGLDSLIAARRVGPQGRVVGIDFSEAMLDRANSSVREIGLANVLFLRSAAEQLPLADACADRALVNGIFNLNPFRNEIFEVDPVHWTRFRLFYSGLAAVLGRPCGRRFSPDLAWRSGRIPALPYPPARLFDSTARPGLPGSVGRIQSGSMR